MTAADPSQPSRYVVGLDLGTTNSAMAFVDTTEKKRTIHTFLVPQVVAPGLVEARETLPSFHYQPASGEFPAESLHLPWSVTGNYTVGHFARDHGTLVPGRQISSAKSWLCHNGVDRTADLLPWQGAEDVDRLSPVKVSARYLEHFRHAWDAQFPEHPLADQDFVLTLPASFDEVARELTIKAAKEAGLSRVVLIEEPQAAFYAWIDKHSDSWEQLVSPGQNILVCDVGGGTTDFTLIRVRSGADGKIQFHRVAVGDHLILGGDNLDLALAHHLENRIKPGGQLEPRQWGVLVRSCRQLKEVLMGENAPEKWTLTMPGSGSKLIGGSIQIQVTREEVESLLADGFFPDVPLDTNPVSSKSGFQEFGLPYASDPAITKYLASFLSAHRDVAANDELIAGSVQSPNNVSSASTNLKWESGNQQNSQRASDHLIRNPSLDAHDPPVAAVLFNGGVFASPVLRDRLIRALERWFRDSDPNWSPIVLDNERLDLAVARGAAYYGMVRRGVGVRINAGLARSYYIGVEGSAADLQSSPTDESSSGQPSNSAVSGLSALCLVPAGIEPGHEIDLSRHKFQLLVSQPIEFPLYVSSTRLTDRPGDLVPIDPEQIKSLPPIRTVLKTGKSKEAASVAVILKAKLTEIGTLDLWCSEVDGKRSWKLLFDVRSATQTDVLAHDASGERQGLFDDDVIQSARDVISNTFSIPTAETAVDIENLKGPQGAKDIPKFNPSRDANQPSVADAAGVVKNLIEVLSLDREEWPTSLLRQLWEALIDCETGRKLSAQHEARWLNLVGYSLRPGYGLAVDDWRCNETWKLLQTNLAFATTACRAEWYILWRRIAGGLTAGQQQALSAPLISQLKQAIRQPGSKGKNVDFGSNTHESAELIRLLGACELIPIAMKRELGDLLLEMLEKPKFSALRPSGYWSLGRVGARRPVYGPLNTVVPADLASRWLMGLVKHDFTEHLVAFAAMQLARKTGDRYRDIDESTRSHVLKSMERAAVASHYRELVAQVTNLETEDESLILGDSLPKGLRIL
ncbi:MAG: Hsp70 family protein [Schlesneria sp.]